MLHRMLAGIRLVGLALTTLHLALCAASTDAGYSRAVLSNGVQVDYVREEGAGFGVRMHVCIDAGSFSAFDKNSQLAFLLGTVLFGDCSAPFRMPHSNAALSTSWTACSTLSIHKAIDAKELDEAIHSISLELLLGHNSIHLLTNGVALLRNYLAEHFSIAEHAAKLERTQYYECCENAESSCKSDLLSLSPEDLQYELCRFYSECIRSDRVKVLLVGDFAPETVATALEQAFGRIPDADPSNSSVGCRQILKSAYLNKIVPILPARVFENGLHSSRLTVVIPDVDTSSHGAYLTYMRFKDMLFAQECSGLSALLESRHLAFAVKPLLYVDGHGGGRIEVEVWLTENGSQQVQLVAGILVAYLRSCKERLRLRHCLKIAEDVGAQMQVFVESILHNTSEHIDELVDLHQFYDLNTIIGAAARPANIDAQLVYDLVAGFFNIRDLCFFHETLEAAERMPADELLDVEAVDDSMDWIDLDRMLNKGTEDEEDSLLAALHELCLNTQESEPSKEESAAADKSVNRSASAQAAAADNGINLTQNSTEDDLSWLFACDEAPPNPWVLNDYAERFSKRLAGDEECSEYPDEGASVAGSAISNDSFENGVGKALVTQEELQSEKHIKLVHESCSLSVHNHAAATTPTVRLVISADSLGGDPAAFASFFVAAEATARLFSSTADKLREQHSVSADVFVTLSDSAAVCIELRGPADRICNLALVFYTACAGFACMAPKEIDFYASMLLARAVSSLTLDPLALAADTLCALVQSQRLHIVTLATGLGDLRKLPKLLPARGLRTTIVVHRITDASFINALFANAVAFTEYGPEKLQSDAPQEPSKREYCAYLGAKFIDIACIAFRHETPGIEPATARLLAEYFEFLNALFAMYLRLHFQLVKAFVRYEMAETGQMLLLFCASRQDDVIVPIYRFLTMLTGSGDLLRRSFEAHLTGPLLDSDWLGVQTAVESLLSSGEYSLLSSHDFSDRIYYIK
ncbi:hypothetical protein PAPHI01_0919 [Pancytospora philotis]|nr:hypothetical protein PAPHI01_0919 [Pancytospora philotis]